MIVVAVVAIAEAEAEGVNITNDVLAAEKEIDDMRKDGIAAGVPKKSDEEATEPVAVNKVEIRTMTVPMNVNLSLSPQ